MCQVFVKDNLKAPKTAEFPSYTNASVSVSGNKYSVNSYVNSENSFGAMIRTNIICVVEPFSGDQWKLVSLDFDE